MPVAASIVRVTISRPSLSVRCLYPPSMDTPGHFERHEQLRAKPLRLRHGAPRQFAATDAGWKPKIVFNSGTAARLPAGRVAIEQQRPQPFRRAVDRRREAGGTGAHNHKVVQIERGRKRSAEALGHLTRLGIAQREPILEEQRGKLARANPGRVEQASRVVRVPRHVEPAIGDEIAREEILDLVRSRRPLMSDQPQSLRLGEILGQPGVEQIVDHREQAFLGWIPRLRQVVIEMRDVDGLDGRVDVRVGREHYAARQRINVARLREDVGPLDARHPLVADHDCQRVASRLELADGGERLFARRRADDRVGLPIPSAEIATHRREHLCIVVNDKQVRACSRLSNGSIDLGERKGDSELRSPGGRVDLDLGIVVDDQAPDDIEAEAGAFPDRLGGEERLEQAPADLGWNARPVVDHAYHDALPLTVRGHLHATGRQEQHRARCRSDSPRSG